MAGAADEPADESADEAAWVRAGLLDPASEHADERQELLVFLCERGVTIEQMVTAQSVVQLNSVAGDS